MLVVCTANICRSVMAAALLGRHAEASGLALRISSAGFIFDDEPPPSDNVAVMAERDLDVSAHRSRIVDAAMVEANDVIVTMERRHARQLSLDVADAAYRIHTLAALVEALPEAPGDDFDQRLRHVHGQRDAADLLSVGFDDVSDPYGRGQREYRKCADRLDELTKRLAAELAR